MTVEENEALVHRLCEEFWDKCNDAALDDIFSADFVDHAPQPGSAGDAANPRQLLLALRAAFSDVQNTADDLVSAGDKVAWRWTFHGTHTGSLMGMPATGKRITLTGITIDRFADGRITERWFQAETLGLLQQLGAIPGPA